MSIEARFFGKVHDHEDGRFHDNEIGGGYGPGTYGAALATALMAGAESFVMPDRTHMTVNYLVQMLRITGRTGEFYDHLQGDEWDDNVPTLTDAAEVRRLRKEARELLGTQFMDAAKVLFAEANYLDRTRPAQGVKAPLASRYTLPKVRVRDARTGSDAIWYAEERGTFCFGAYELSAQKLGRILALTLMKGSEWVVIGDDETERQCGYVYEVTVNYVVEMLRETGLYGSFCDLDDETFDPNVPTHDGL